MPKEDLRSLRGGCIEWCECLDRAGAKKGSHEAPPIRRTHTPEGWNAFSGSLPEYPAVCLEVRLLYEEAVPLLEDQLVPVRPQEMRQHQGRCRFPQSSALYTQHAAYC